jgi:hypothetical protein
MSTRLDGWRRDKNGEISRKHGNTLVGTLRKIYSPSFVHGQSKEAKLSDVLAKLSEHSLSQLVHVQGSGGLDTKCENQLSTKDLPSVTVFCWLAFGYDISSCRPAAHRLVLSPRGASVEMHQRRMYWPSHAVGRLASAASLKASVRSTRPVSCTVGRHGLNRPGVATHRRPPPNGSVGCAAIMIQNDNARLGRALARPNRVFSKLSVQFDRVICAIGDREAADFGGRSTGRASAAFGPHRLPVTACASVVQRDRGHTRRPSFRRFCETDFASRRCRSQSVRQRSRFENDDTGLDALVAC